MLYALVTALDKNNTHKFYKKWLFIKYWGKNKSDEVILILYSTASSGMDCFRNVSVSPTLQQAILFRKILQKQK